METATVEILNWDKYNPRKDVKRPHWFAFSNRMIEDSQFFEFTAEEFKAWVYILSQASQKMNAVIIINFQHAERVCGIKRESFEVALRKLEQLQCVHVSVRDPYTSVRDPYATLHNKQTEQTEQNKTLRTTSSTPPENLVKVYCDLWKQRNGKSPDITGKEAGQLNRLAKELGFQRSSELVRSYFSMPDPFFLKRGYDVSTLILNKTAIAQFESSGKIVTSELVKQVEKKIDKLQNTRQKKSFDEVEAEYAAMKADAEKSRLKLVES